MQAELVELIRRIEKRDQNALAAFHDRTLTRVYTIIVRILGNAADSEEVALEVYQQVWGQAERYEPSRGPVMAWLTVLARSRALDHLRRENRRTQHLSSNPATYQEDRESVVEDLLEVTETSTRIHQALSALSETQRRTITLAFLKGYTHQEIADALNMPLGTVKSNIRRGLQQLKQTLET